MMDICGFYFMYHGPGSEPLPAHSDREVEGKRRGRRQGEDGGEWGMMG